MPTAAIDWRTNYRAVFGNLTDKQAEAWVEFAHKNLPNGIGAGEIDRAVAFLCDDWPRDAKRHPGVRDICDAIRKSRLKAAGIDTSIPFPVRQAEAQIHRTPVDGLERWEIVCGIAGLMYSGKLTRDYAPHLAKYAIANGGLTIPYWAASESRRQRCRVVERDTYVAGLPDDMRAVYERLQSVDGLAGVAAAVAFEGRMERPGAYRRGPT